MLSLQDIRQDQDLINEIDWEMTPEKAVSLYLEWGNGWNHGGQDGEVQGRRILLFR